MELPTKVRKAKSVNPEMLLIYASPKAGKTTISAQLPNHLILELESGGANYVDCNVLELNKASEFNEALTTIENAPDGTYDYLVIDTATRLDEWSEIVGTWNYMDKPQGKKFNRIGTGADSKKMMPNHPEFESVHTLGEGFGYRYSREVMIEWYDRLERIAKSGKVKCVIFLAHIKDKFVETKTGNTVEVFDINLTGKVKSNYCSRVDAVGYFYRKNGKGYLNFNNENKVIIGGRCTHLDGEVLISEKQEDGTIKTFWENVFLSNN